MLFVGLLAATPAQASPVPLSFRAPAEFQHTGNATGLEWALLIFHGSTNATFSLHAQPERAVNHTTLFYGMMAANKTGAQLPVPLPEQAVPVGALLEQGLAFGGKGWSSLYLEASRLQLTHADAQGNLLPLHRGQPVADALSAPLPPITAFRSDLAAWSDGAALNLQSTGAFPFTLHATGLRRAEWSNAQTGCASACLDGAKTEGAETGNVGGTYAAVLRVSYLEAITQDGTLDGAGTAWLAAAGGRSVTLHEQGSVRLPLASRTTACESEPCLSPSNQTVSLYGNVTLENLGLAGNRLKADVSGALEAARLDEQSVSPSFFAALPVTVVGAVAIGALVVAWLFSRVLSPRKALEHPKRNRLHAEVQAHPGATITTLQELTGYPRTVVRKHLKALERVGLVVSNAHAGQRHYFENHGRYSDSWRSMAAARDGELRPLLDWLRNHPDSAQADVVQQAHSWGLSRSAVQRRLDRLVAWGLVEIQR
ncbi:MAG: MarR family transcriptional regulator, partial [Halobacteriales archaeon]|nr:MarR family transcriptional regulator [Halobacteriales archaeon]